MAKTLQAKKRKVAPKKAAKPEEKKIVLVGTYKAGQLERWPGWYNYPISAKDKIDEQAAKRVTELWLFRGKEDGRYFAAEFVGVKDALGTRQRLRLQGDG